MGFPGKDVIKAIQWMDQIQASGQQVLVNCAAGRSRSSSLVIAYLIIRQGHTYDSALALCKAKRPIAQPNPNFEDQLRNIERSKMMQDAPGTPSQPKGHRHSHNHLRRNTTPDNYFQPTQPVPSSATRSARPLQAQYRFPNSFQDARQFGY